MKRTILSVLTLVVAGFGAAQARPLPSTTTIKVQLPVEYNFTRTEGADSFGKYLAFRLSPTQVPPRR